MPGSERLHGGLLRGKPRGERRRRVAFPAAIGDLCFGEHPVDEAVAVAFDRFGDAGDLGRIDAGAYNFHSRRSYMTLPDVPESFSWAESPAGPVLTCRPLDAVAAHIFTTRELRLSSAQDWDRVASALGVGAVLTVNQVHGRVVRVASTGATAAEERPDADALVTRDPAHAVAVRAAD